MDSKATCLDFSVYSALRGAVIGSIWGLCVSSFEVPTSHLKGMGVLKHFSGHTFKSSFIFATYVGGFTALNCGLQRTRGKDDVWNTIMASTIIALATTLPTKDPKFIGSTTAIACAAATAIYVQHGPIYDM